MDKLLLLICKLKKLDLLKEVLKKRISITSVLARRHMVINYLTSLYEYFIYRKRNRDLQLLQEIFFFFKSPIVAERIIYKYNQAVNLVAPSMAQGTTYFAGIDNKTKELLLL